MDQKIHIRKSPTADTRTATSFVSKEELGKSSAMHISDVAKAMRWFADRIEMAGENHDWTKMEYLDEFYKQFHKAQETGEWGTGWYDDIHIEKERHHLKDNCPDDVDFIDIIEFICDGVMAGLARSGKYTPEQIPDGLLQKAYYNTIEKLLNQVEVEE